MWPVAGRWAGIVPVDIAIRVGDLEINRKFALPLL